jgi:hypothetical protein
VFAEDVVALVSHWTSKKGPFVAATARYHERISPFIAKRPGTKDDPQCCSRVWRVAVDSPILLELAESWYKCSKFHVRERKPKFPEEVSCRPLDTTLEKDRFQQGLQPHLLIADITHDVSVPPPHGWPPSRCVYEALRELLNRFHRMRKGARIHLQLYFPGNKKNSREYHEHLPPFLRDIMPYILQLREAGYNMEITLREYNHEFLRATRQFDRLNAALTSFRAEKMNTSGD